MKWDIQCIYLFASFLEEAEDEEWEEPVLLNPDFAFPAIYKKQILVMSTNTQTHTHL